MLPAVLGRPLEPDVVEDVLVAEEIAEQVRLSVGGRTEGVEDVRAPPLMVWGVEQVSEPWAAARPANIRETGRAKRMDTVVWNIREGSSGVPPLLNR